MAEITYRRIVEIDHKTSHDDLIVTQVVFVIGEKQIPFVSSIYEYARIEENVEAIIREGLQHKVVKSAIVDATNNTNMLICQYGVELPID